MDEQPDALWKAGKMLHEEASRFHHIRVSLEGRTPGEQRELLSSQVSLEPKIRQVIDEACRLWIEKRQWPQMSRDHAIQVSDRIGEGILTGGFLFHHGLRCPQKTENDVLTFLLIDSWAAFGRKAVMSRLLLLK